MPENSSTPFWVGEKKESDNFVHKLDDKFEERFDELSTAIYIPDYDFKSHLAYGFLEEEEQDEFIDLRIETKLIDECFYAIDQKFLEDNIIMIYKSAPVKRASLYAKRAYETLIDLYPQCDDLVRLVIRSTRLGFWKAPQGRGMQRRWGYNYAKDQSRNNYLRAIWFKELYEVLKEKLPKYTLKQIRYPLQNLIARINVRNGHQIQMIEDTLWITFILFYFESYIARSDENQANEIISVGKERLSLDAQDYLKRHLHEPFLRNYWL